MTPFEAKNVLDEMGVTEQLAIGNRFQIVRCPQRKDLAAFVMAVKTLGAWSVQTDVPARVGVERGFRGDELIFKLN